MSFILNTNSGVLHTKPCADGETGNTPVEAGSRKHYSKYEHAIEDDDYHHDHNHPNCLGDEE